MALDTQHPPPTGPATRTASALLPGRPSGRRRRWVFPAGTELALVVGFYLLYRTGRLLTADAEETARSNAQWILDLERALRIPSEAAIQGSVHAIQLFEAANVYYVSAHFPLAIAFLVWGFVTRPCAEYVWARNLLAFQTLIAVVIHIALPLAPPRMFPEWGFVDTMDLYGPSAYDGTGATLTNQYAAMPSLHVGWAILIAVVVGRTGPPSSDS